VGDKMSDSFCHIHTHNEYSFLDGFGKAEAWAEHAKNMGFKHLGLTNHHNIDGCLKFQAACKEIGIHSVLGAELYMVPDVSEKIKGETRYHIVLFAKNLVGWRNILQLISEANMQGFYYKPRIDPIILMEHLEGVIVTTACSSSFDQPKE
jgi:DNA polymerase-3 subunit alpha